MATQLKKGWLQELMMSLFLKEATYNADVVMSAANACSMKRFEFNPDWPDVVDNDKGEITGTEHGTDQEIIEQRFAGTYTEPKTKPNSVAGLAALVLGDITSTKDGAEDAWRHKIVPVAVGTALPSMNLEHIKGGVQHKYNGVRGNSLKLAGVAGEFISLEAALMGSGTRAVSAVAFPAAITESVLPANLCSAWLESGSDISITATLVQASEDISGATPADIKARLKSFEFMFNNNLEEIPGFGGAGVLQDSDYGRRTIDFKAEIIFNDITELNHYLAQDELAIEIDCKGAQITGASTFFYGFQLIIPRFKLKTAPHPQGGVGDTLTLNIEGDVQDDGVNDACIIEVYNGQAAYLA
jgi:hypothetical protein